MADSRSAATLLREIIESKLSDLPTALPGRIVSYDAEHQLVNVDIQTDRVLLTKDNTIYKEPFARLQDVPVVFPRGGGGFMTFPLVPGDKVLLMFCLFDIGQYWQTGERTYADMRAHDFSFAVAFAGFYPDTQKLANVSTTGVEFGMEGGARIHIEGNSIQCRAGISAASHKAARDDRTENADMAIWNALLSHTHSGAGPAQVSGPQPGAVGSDLVRID